MLNFHLTENALEATSMALRGFLPGEIIDAADLALGIFLEEYGDEDPTAKFNPDGITRLNYVNINHALRSQRRTIAEN